LLLGTQDETRTLSDFQPQQGLAFSAGARKCGVSDQIGQSMLRMFEGDVELSPHAQPSDIAELGGGRFSHWGDFVQFASTDGSDPRTNGRIYSVVIPSRAGHEWPFLTAGLMALIILGFRLRAVGARQGEKGELAEPPPPPPASLGTWIAVGSLLAVAACAFVYGSMVQSMTRNIDMDGGDQSAYMQYSHSLLAEHPGAVIERNRMPGFPFIMTLVDDPHRADDEFFLQAKMLNAGLSLLLLAICYLLLRSQLAVIPALTILLISGLTVFIYKAGWAQAELTYYCGTLAVFLAFGRLLHRPTLLFATLTGVLAGLVQLTKASVLPGLLLYLALGVLSAVIALRNRDIANSDRCRRFAAPALVATLFLATMWPYISTSKEVFGAYFYNVNSTFYMWYDTWQECLDGTGAHLDVYQWPDMPAEEIPSAARWFEENGVSGGIERMREGAKALMHTMKRNPFGFLPFAALFPFLALLTCAACARRAVRLAREYWVLLAFALAYVSGYTALYVWYAKLISQPRFVLALFLPMLLACSMVMTHASRWYPPLQLGSERISLVSCLHLALYGLLIPEVLMILGGRVAYMGGAM